MLEGMRPLRCGELRGWCEVEGRETWVVEGSGGIYTVRGTSPCGAGTDGVAVIFSLVVC